MKWTAYTQEHTNCELIYIRRILIPKFRAEFCTAGQLHCSGLIFLTPSEELLLMLPLPIANLLEPFHIGPLNFRLYSLPASPTGHC